MDIGEISELLYSQNSDLVKSYLENSTEPEALHFYSCNYNWNNGFDIPYIIMKNPFCSKSTALTMFYLADGYSYLSEKTKGDPTSKWSTFIEDLYVRIKSDTFPESKIGFTVPLSKVQIFKLVKMLSEDEYCFITNINGTECNFAV